MKRNSVRGKRAIVTGGAGVIGRELLKLLIKKRASILSVDRNPLSEDNWDGVAHIQRDLAADSLDELRDFEPQIIFHLAAAFERSKESPAFWKTNWHDNALLSHRIVELAQETASLEACVFASSYLIYSPSLYLSSVLQDNVVCLKEKDPVEPRNLTGAAKYYTERELEFVREFARPSLRGVYARIFRVYGCGSKDVISRWIRDALSSKVIEVYNKENRFDFIYAGDVAEGLLRLAENPDAQGPINLGSGIAWSIQELLAILAEHGSTKTMKIQDLGKTEHFEASYADLTRLKQLTGWIPTTDFRKGINILVKSEQTLR